MLKVHYRGIAGCGGFTGALTSAKVEEVAVLACMSAHASTCAKQQHPFDKE